MALIQSILNLEHNYAIIIIINNFNCNFDIILCATCFSNCVVHNSKHDKETIFIGATLDFARIRFEQ